MDEEKKTTLLEKIGRFLGGKGFYIVLFLCVAAIGISGYVVFSGGPEDPVDPSLYNPSTSAPSTTAPNTTARTLPSAGVSTTAPPVTLPPVTADVVATTTDSKEVAGTASDTPPQASTNTPKLFYVRPVSGELLRSYSGDVPVFNPTMQDWRVHTGTDLLAPVGSEVMAVATGEVIGIDNDYFKGTTVTVLNADGVEVRYCGLDGNISVAVGRVVAAGDIIGRVGESALFESGDEPHLHLEMLKDGEYIDPMSLLP